MNRTENTIPEMCGCDSHAMYTPFHRTVITMSRKETGK